MKKGFIISGFALAIILLLVFNKLASRRDSSNLFAEAKKGIFEIAVTNSGELLAEISIDIKGPEIMQNDQHGHKGGGDMHAMDLKILDIVPEGTLVKEGDYIAQLDRTLYENTLKDELQNLTILQTNVEMKRLDTAVVLTNLRDDIKNQLYAVEEAGITLEQSKFEPPATIRQATINLDKALRTLEQKKKGYELKVAQSLKSITREEKHLTTGTMLVDDLQEFLSKFTIRAPADGMVTYKKDRSGVKRKAGSTISPYSNVIATLPELGSMISKTYVNEIDISKIKAGQNVTIHIDAFPEKKFTGKVMSIANVGETLPNSDSKMFEVLIKVSESDHSLRPSMTTTNQIITKSFEDVVFIPTECVRTGSDSIPFVYEKNRTRQIVVPGESNEKNVIIEQGLEAGTQIYLIRPENAESFRLKGENLIPVIRERDKIRKTENTRYMQ